jgi:hypothetical protein
MTGRFYTLDDNGVPVECRNELEWANWFGTANRTVARTQVTPWIEVSTVFLGLDHRWYGDGPPILYETMVFVDTGKQRRYFGRGPLRPVYDDTLEHQRRYATRAEALREHAKIVRQIRARVSEIDKLRPTPVRCETSKSKR